MPVITADVTLKGLRRDAAFQWLSQPENHARFLRGAFDPVEEKAPGHLVLGVALGCCVHRFDYAFEGTDDAHGGRRVLVNTSSRRVRGALRYSLRTEKPSTDTLVTLHLDYDPGWVGLVLDPLFLRKKLDAAFAASLQNLAREIVAG